MTQARPLGPLTALSAQALAIGYPRRILAADITFAVHHGDALAVLGPNGSGKTTLFRTLLGLLPSRAGCVTLGSQSLSNMLPPDIARQIAYVPQSTAGFFNFSVLEVVEMARAPHLAWFASPGPHDRDVAMRALTTLNLAAFAGRDFAELSGGERQLVMIARALASEAKILLLDEPASNLDFGNRLMVFDALLRLKHDGMTIIFTTHDPSHAFHLCNGANDRTMTISRAGEVTIGSTATVLTKPALAALYGVDERAVPDYAG